MKMRNRFLQSLSVLVVGSSLCASPAELTSVDVHAFMEAHKQKLAEKIITTINDFWAVDTACPQDERVSLKEFQKQFDEYRSYFPQGDAHVDQTLRNILDMRMREKLLRIMSLHNELNKQIAQKEKGFIYNIQAELIYIACGLAAISCVFWKLRQVFQLSAEQDSFCEISAFFSGVLSAPALAEGLNGYRYLAVEIQNLTDIVQLCQQDVLQLDQAYDYAFPGEEKLSEQVQALFQQVQEIGAVFKSVPE